MVGRLLAQMGVGNISLYDPDTIEEVNLAPQGWPERAVGVQKVGELRREMMELNSTINIVDYICYFPPHHLERYDVRFCCVDTIEARNVIWSHMPKKGLLVDGRSAGECLEVYGVDCSSETAREAYQKTLFAQEEAYQGACTTVSLNYTAAIAAGLEISQYARWVRGMPLTHTKLNILSGEMESKVIR